MAQHQSFLSTARGQVRSAQASSGTQEERAFFCSESLSQIRSSDTFWWDLGLKGAGSDEENDDDAGRGKTLLWRASLTQRKHVFVFASLHTQITRKCESKKCAVGLETLMFCAIGMLLFFMMQQI